MRRAMVGLISGLIAVGVGGAAVASAADVVVYAEGAYTKTDLTVYLYANITGPAVLSQGVKLTYSTLKLSSPQATKNEAVWYMGTPASKNPYMNPDTSVPGEVVFIGGKLDTGNPTAGVQGTRVLLGTVKFTRTTAETSLPAPESFFGVQIGLGKGGSYDNFVTTSGVVLDQGVDFSTKGVLVRERGDANLDHKLTNLDYFAIRTAITNNAKYDSYPYAVIIDCNADGVITNLDLFCVKNKL